MKLQAAMTIARDVGFLVIGLGGIIFQQVTGRISVELLLVYTTLLGVPGAIGLIQLSRGSKEIPPTATLPSSSPSSPSSPLPP